MTAVEKELKLIQDQQRRLSKRISAIEKIAQREKEGVDALMQVAIAKNAARRGHKY